MQPSGTSASSLPSIALKLANGGQVTVGVPYLPTNLNPSVPAGANRVTEMVMSQVWPQAFVTDPQFTAETTGFLDSAELVGVSPQTIVYKIDKGARWSDGVPITVDDFVYNWHEQLAHAASSAIPGVLGGYADIASITGSDGGRTVTVVFKQPYSDWEGLFANLVPAHVGRRVGWDGFAAGTADLADAVSGGPFEISSEVPGVSLTLRRNPHWWGTAAHLSSIVFRVVRGNAAIWAAMRSGEIDVGEVQPAASDQVEAALDGLDSATTLSPVLWQLCFNVTDATVAEPAIRSAITLAMDRTELVSDTIGLDDPGIPTADDRIFLQNEPGFSSDAGQYDAADDPDAESLLEAAGYTLAPNGYLERAGRAFTITVTGPSGSALVGSLEAELAAQMKDAGIVLHTHNVPLGRLLTQILPSSDYQMALAPFVGGVYPSWTEPLYSDTVPGVTPGTVPASGATGTSGGGSGGTGTGAGAGVTGVTGAAGVTGSGSSPAALPAGAPASDGATGESAAGDPAGPAAGGLPTAGSTSVGGSGGPAGALVAVASDVSGLSDPAVTSLYAEAAAALDAPTSRNLYDEVDALLWQDLPTVPLFQMPVTLLTAHDLVNVEESPTQVGVMWDAADWAIALNLPAPAPSGS